MPNGSQDQWRTSLDVTNNRVSTLEKSVTDLASSQERLGLRLSAEISSIHNGLSSEIKSLAGQFADRSKIPWPALGVMLSFVLAVGGLVYWPIKDNQNDMREAIKHLAELTISKAEFEYRLKIAAERRDDLQRQAEQRDKETAEALEKIRDRIVPRSEHEEKWRANDQRFVDVQRQVDDVKRAFGDTFSLRDALQQMQKRIDQLEVQRAARG